MGLREKLARIFKKILRKKKKKKEFKTVRTSAVEKQLRNAGLSEKEIRKLRGKK